MSVVSSFVISMLEKELVGAEPAIEAFVMNLVSVVAKDLISYIENRVGVQPDAASTSMNGE